MPNYAALKSYIAAQPAGTSDATMIAAVNAASIAVPAYVATSSIAAYLGTQGKLAALMKWTPPSGGFAMGEKFVCTYAPPISTVEPMKVG